MEKINIFYFVQFFLKNTVQFYISWIIVGLFFFILFPSKTKKEFYATFKEYVYYILVSIYFKATLSFSLIFIFFYEYLIYKKHHFSVDISFLPFILQVVLLFFIAEFFNYWIHFILHKNSFLYKISHKVHHDIKVLRWPNGPHDHFIVLFCGIFVLFLLSLLLSLSPYVFLTTSFLLKISGNFSHLGDRYTYKLQNTFLKYFILFPEIHAKHHVNEEIWFGGHTPLYDYLFRTNQN